MWVGRATGWRGVPSGRWSGYGWPLGAKTVIVGCQSGYWWLPKPLLVVAKALATASLVVAKAILISMALAAVLSSSGIPITGYRESDSRPCHESYHDPQPNLLARRCESMRNDENRIECAICVEKDLQTELVFEMWSCGAHGML